MKPTCRELLDLINSGSWGLTDAPNVLASRVGQVLDELPRWNGESRLLAEKVVDILNGARQ